MPPPRSRRITLICLAAALVGLAWWIFGIRDKSASLPPSGGVVTHSPGSAPSLDKGRSATTGNGNPSLRPDFTPESLNELRQWIESLPKDQALAWIRLFLENGTDKNTGLSFEIAVDGSLKQWPTFRTYLLDTLSTLDPAAAAAISRGILAKSSTADEWALAMRNVGRVESTDESRDFLRQKTEELIQNPAWQASPSVGYLNAFDVLVHTRATESAPLLSTLVQDKERKDLAHAAFLTLDRLVQRQPAEMLGRLAADTALHQRRPEMTAQQFARADLRDATQREIVKTWLLDPARTTAQLTSFAGVFPNHNQFVSNNLLTRDAPVSGADLAAHDREALGIIQSWTDDPAFKPLSETMSVMISRLQGFVNAAQSTSSAPKE